ncbi:MAG TPA: YetF domain-containing protein [Blastocatellia bacterium]|nr:YetF domain-containing protein [Blastocatellia bacterium]
MEIYRIVLRVLFAYIFLHALLRLSGKRTVAEGRSFDFVVALILGDMIDDMIWAEVPASQFVVGAGTLVLAQVALSLGSYASQTFAGLVEGKPAMIVRDGTLMRGAMRAERLNEKDVEALLRHKGLQRSRWREVKTAWLEDNGEPSVLKKEWAEPAQKRELEKLKEAAQ